MIALNRRSVLYGLGVLAMPLLLLLVVFGIDRPIPEDLPYWINDAAIANGEGSGPDQLPWTRRGAIADENGIIRSSALAEFEAKPDNQLWAVLVPRPNSAFSIEVNDNLVGEFGQMTRPVSWLRWPVLAEFSGGLLQTGGNRLRIKTATETTSAHVPTMLVGPSNVLRPHYQRVRFFGVTVVRILVVAMVLLAMLIFGLFLLRRQDTVYGWFSLTLLVWSAHTLHDQIQWLPIPNRHLWFTLSYLSLGWFVILSVIFVHRVLGRRPLWTERWVLTIGGVGSAVLLWRSSSCGNCFYPMAQNIWVPAIILIGVYVASLLAVHAWRHQQPEFRWLGAAAWLACIVGVRDYLWEMRILPAGSTYYLAYASAIVLVVFAAIMLKRFASALGEAEVLNDELEQRVANKADQLKRNYDALTRSERQRARLQERQSIMRDMHDGLGGDLVQTLAIIDKQGGQGDVREAVQRCLNDLRLILDSSELDGGDVVELIGTFRHRVDRGLRRAGITISLKIDDLPVCAWLDGALSLHLMRVLQESINNIVKHANASKIRLTVDYLSEPKNLLRIQISDNGVGIGEALRIGEGHGLGNIQWRAKILGAKVWHENNHPGTVVHILLPMLVGPTVVEIQADPPLRGAATRPEPPSFK